MALSSENPEGDGSTLEEILGGEQEVVVDVDDEGSKRELVSFQRHQDQKIRKMRQELLAIKRLWAVEEAEYDRRAEDRRTGEEGGGIGELEKVMDMIAGTSRDVQWSIPIGDSGVFDFVLEMLKAGKDIRSSLMILILRVVGNACADTDENRARVISANALPFIIAQLYVPESVPFAIPVLYNVCLDYESAQKEASQCQLSKELVELAMSERFDGHRELVGYVCRTLDLLVTQSVEVDLALPNTPRILLSLALSKQRPPDVEDFICLVTTSLTYLQQARFQNALITSSTGIETGLSILSATSTQASASAEEAAQLTNLRTTLIHLLSDISALPLFSTTFSPASPLIKTLVEHLSSPEALSTTAAIILGNLARSDAACLAFVHESQIHIPLIKALSTATSAQQIHASLGCLKNLALPKENKAVIGATSGLWHTLEKLWPRQSEDAVILSSISLARQLCIGCLENTKCILVPAQQSSPGVAEPQTRLHLLTTIFHKTDTQPIKLEISRLVAGIWKVLSTIPDEDNTKEIERMRKELSTHYPEIGEVLAYMLVQKQWKAVRSEAWFVLGLMARDEQGVVLVEKTLGEEGISELVKEVLVGEEGREIEAVDSNATGELDAALARPQTTIGDSTPEVEGVGGQSSQPPSAGANVARADRENVLVLLTEMLKQRGMAMASEQKTMLEGLVRRGSEALASAKEGKMAVGKDAV